MGETDSKVRPRLLQMMLSTQPGGAEAFFEKLTAALAEAGVSQCVVVEPNAERERWLAVAPGVEVVPIRFGGWREPLARRALRSTFERFQPNVALSWMNRASRRVPSGYCPVAGRLGGYYKLKHYRNCDHLVGITPDLVEHIRGGGWSAERSRLIPNFGEVGATPDDPEAARREVRDDLGVDADTSVLLALGRLHEVKAHDTLIRALVGLKQPATLLVAGEGPLRGELEALAASLGVADRVRLLGWRRDVGRLFAACDIAVFPSRYEPNGTVVMESWAQGRPLIAARAKGPEWLVEDGVNGLLFDIDTVEQLTERLDRLMADAELRLSLVAAGRETFESGFSKERVVAAYLELFAAMRGERG